MKLLTRIFNHYAVKDSQKVALDMGIHSFDVRKVDGKNNFFVALGVENLGHSEFQMATLAFWPEIPAEANYSGPRLEFSMLQNPGKHPISMASIFCAEFSNEESRSFTALCMEVIKYADLLFQATGGEG